MEKRIIESLYELILDRKKNPRNGSYTCQLFSKGKDEILKKIGEETVEAILASKGQGKSQLIYELADLIYHILVLMAEEGIKLDDVYLELKRRSGRSVLRR